MGTEAAGEPGGQLKKSQERINRLKALSLKLKTSSGINELENEPAYKRRSIQLDDIPHSSDDNISRYTLSEDDENKTKLRENNSFLHDNVD
jgi:cell division protein FtsZ